jgi:hypothetical protein
VKTPDQGFPFLNSFFRDVYVHKGVNPDFKNPALNPMILFLEYPVVLS